MTRKQRRLWIVLACLVSLGTATGLTLAAFRDTLVFFVAPSDIATKAAPGRMVRLGGLVEAGSLSHTQIGGKPAAAFRVTDGVQAVGVEYVGVLPDLFREGQGVVALGMLRRDGVFAASEVLAKHDETYMPPEVADALKKSGRWNPATGKPPEAASLNAKPLAGPPKTGG